jgi:hypothetical protein
MKTPAIGSLRTGTTATAGDLHSAGRHQGLHGGFIYAEGRGRVKKNK